MTPVRPCHLCGLAVLGIPAGLGARCTPGGPLAQAGPAETTEFGHDQSQQTRIFYHAAFETMLFILKELQRSENILFQLPSPATVATE